MLQTLSKSNVEWIGQIPSQWKLSRLKYLVSTTDKKTDVFSEYIALENVESWSGRYVPTEGEIPEVESKEIHKGDVLFSKLRPYLAKATVAPFDGACSSEFIVFRNSELETRYLLYLLLSRDFVFLVDSGAYGTKMPRSNWDFIGSIVVPLPSQKEQEKIGTFLDSECNRMDSLSNLSREKIQKLKELKQSIITEAVTKGLDSSVEMKNSEKEWIHQIPKNWEVRPLKCTFKMRKGLEISKSDITKSGLPVISYGQIHAKYNPGSRITDELIRYIDRESQKMDSQSPTSIGDLIFADTSEDLEGCGNCVYVDRDGIYAGYHTIILHSDGMEPSQYYAYQFMSDVWRAQLRAIVQAVKVYSITQDKLSQVDVLCPPFNEQCEIVHYLDSECSRIDSLIQLEEEKIEKLAEYKQSMIYEFVTGKKEVPR